MSQRHNDRSLLPQDTSFDNADQPGLAQPFSQAEVDELLYGTDRRVEERLGRLREIRDELAGRESADWGDEDPAALLAEVDRAIEALGTDEANADDTDDYAGLSPALVPEDDLESLSPDDVDARAAIEGPDEDDDDAEEPGILDESEWDDGDDFRPERGVH
ncbi:hypothetical protein [uncultured Devosia sp.]|uniref:hypothetical protein n=1 Tax=uncultured Devosia sp. TaxID=211434 RepID=UPI0035CA3368